MLYRFQRNIRIYWYRLTQPHPAVQSELEIAEARLVAGLSLALLLTSLLVGLLWQLTSPDFQAAPFVSVVTITGLFISYWLSRSKHYKLASYIVVFTVIVIIVILMLVTPGFPADRMLVLSFLNIAILLASLLLSVRFTLIAAIIGMLGTILFANLGEVSAETTFAYIVFMDVMAALLLLASLMRNSYLRQILQSQSRYQALFNQSNDAVFIIDLDGKHLEVNQSGAEMLGYTVEEASNLTFEDVVAPTELDSGRNVLKRLLNNERLPIYERIFRRKDGTEFPVEINVELVFDEEGRPLHIQSIARDITERKEAETALRASEERFRRLTLQSPDTIYIFNMEKNQMEFFNGDSFLGYSVEELKQPGSIINQTHPDDLERVLNFWQLISSSSESGIAVDYRLRHKKGHWEWIHNRAIILSRTAENDPGEVLVVLTIITPAKRVEDQLRQQEEYLRILIEQTPIGIVTVDMNGRLTEANPRTLEIIGAPNDGQTFNANLLDVESLLKVGISQQLSEAIKTGQKIEFETWFTSAWGKTVYILLRMVPYFDGQGNQLGLIILVEDLTERVRAEEGLREMQKLDSLSVLAGGIAHDFNNLLVAMLGQTSLAQAKLRPESPGRPHVDKAVAAAKQASRLTQQLLGYSGRGHFQIAHLDLNAMIEENLHLFAATIPKHIHLRTDLAADLPMVEVDLAQMQQVVMNLIINAAEAVGGERGTISVMTATQYMTANEDRYWQHTMKPMGEGLYVTLEVHDNGEGMDRETMSKIFDPFFTTKEKGHGLGLAAVLGIIKGHHGGLTVYSELGKGTTFKIFLPASDSPVPIIEEGVQREAVNTSGFVLIIDDEEYVRMAVADILALENIEVISAADGHEGLAIYKERQDEIGMVLLDLSMPGWSGEMTLRELQKVNPQVPIVLSSGYNEVEATRLFFGKGLVGFLQKPYSANKLLETVRQYL